MENITKKIISALLDDAEYEQRETEMRKKADKKFDEHLSKLNKPISIYNNAVEDAFYDACSSRLLFGLEEGFKLGYRTAVQLFSECEIITPSDKSESIEP